jgi:hypothetical protein
MKLTEPVDEALKVLAFDEGVTLGGQVNVSDETILTNIRSAIRRGHPQVRGDAPKMDHIVLVGGGPSLADTEHELVALVHAGAKIATLNGAYHWCLARHLRPSMQIVMDARPTNVRFLEPYVPACTYLLASQCHPDLWEAVEGRERVWIFHALNPESPERSVLDTYYAGQWQGVGGGTTVATRALALLRMLGYLRFDLFGIDSCWMGDQHHAYDQPENQRDRRIRLTVTPDGATEGRTFTCAPWHVKQFEDFLQMIRVNGQHFLLHVHGDGLLAYAMRSSSVTLAEG